MSTNITNQVAYLRTSRSFPEDIHELSFEINKTYVDIANTVNSRTIGIFPFNSSAQTGEKWFFTSQGQAGFRQIYSFTSAGNVPHGLQLRSINQFTKCSGSYTDGTNWYGAIFGSNVAISGQISFYITPKNIVILAGAGTPTISKGSIVLEWLSQI
jgi:hypothetical protein